MTTVAIANGIMCSDNQETTEHGHAYACKKIYKVTSGRFKGHIIGTVGGSFSSMLFVDWYRAGGVRNVSKECLADGISTVDVYGEHDLFECVILTPKGILVVDKSFRPIPVIGDTYAAGSGGAIARGVLDMGGTAEKAVRIACKRDTYSSDMDLPLQKAKVSGWEGGFSTKDEGYNPLRYK